MNQTLPRIVKYSTIPLIEPMDYTYFYTLVLAKGSPIQPLEFIIESLFDKSYFFVLNKRS